MITTRKGEALIIVLLISSQASSALSRQESVASRPRASSGATATATIRILRPVTVKDGKVDAKDPYTKRKSKIQGADGQWHEIEIFDFQ